MIAVLNLRYVGSTWKNCGPTSGQTDALQADQNFQKLLTQDYSQIFGQNQALFKNLTTNLGLITSAGVGQQGFSAPELATKNSQAINAASASNQKLQTAIGENAALHGNADPGVESGIVQAEKAQAATAVDTNLNNNLADITQQNYATGRQNYWQATGATEAAPGAFENPSNAAGGTVVGANQETGTEANSVASSSIGNELLGLTEGLGSDAATAAGAISKTANS
jgi:hypothetical protein